MVHMYFEIEMVNTNKPIIFWWKSQNSDATFNFANEEKLFHFPSTGSAVKKNIILEIFKYSQLTSEEQ